MDFHFLHTADIHLDSPLRGLGAYDGAPAERFRNATREALRNLTDHAIRTGAAFVVIAGDLYDEDWKDFGTGLFLIAELERLNAAGIRVAILFGNHDAASQITKSLPWPGNAFRFDHRRASTITFDDLGVALHGRSFDRPDVATNLVDGYPRPVPGRLNIGVLHTALEGPTRHRNYAPCSLAQLRGYGYEYWALGHVHGFDIRCRDPWIVYPGNLQGRHIRETGPKGCVSVSVRDGAVVGVEPVVLDVARWVLAEVDARGCDGIEALHDRCVAAARAALAAEADGRPAALRVRVGGSTALHGELADRLDAIENGLRAALLGLGEVWLESVQLRTAPPAITDAEAERESGDLLSRLLADAGGDIDVLTALEEALRPLVDKMPAKLDDGLEAGDAAEDLPLLTALRAGDFGAIAGLVMPSLLARGGEG